MTTAWKRVLGDVAAQLNRHQVRWMLVGSAATALRGAAIEPGDIDITLGSPEDVERAAELLPTPDVQVPQDTGASTWISTVSAPTLRFGTSQQQWTFGRWVIGGVKVELAHIDSPGTATLYLETRSQVSWRQRETLHCAGQSVPTVPIEPQLATMVARGQTSRIDATLSAIDLPSLDLQRLVRALDDKRMETPDLVIPGPIQDLIHDPRRRPHG